LIKSISFKDNSHYLATVQKRNYTHLCVLSRSRLLLLFVPVPELLPTVFLHDPDLETDFTGDSILFTLLFLEFAQIESGTLLLLDFRFPILSNRKKVEVDNEGTENCKQPRQKAICILFSVPRSKLIFSIPVPETASLLQLEMNGSE